MCGIIIFQGREEKKISMSPVGASCFSVLYSQLSITKKRWKKSLWHQPSSHPSSYVFAWTAHAVKYPWNTVHSKYKPQPTPFYWPPYTHPKVPTDKIHLKAAKLSRTSQPKVEIPPPHKPMCLWCSPSCWLTTINKVTQTKNPDIRDNSSPSLSLTSCIWSTLRSVHSICEAYLKSILSIQFLGLLLTISPGNFSLELAH